VRAGSYRPENLVRNPASSGSETQRGAPQGRASTGVVETTYDRCLLTSFVISNIETVFLPPKTT
jgi:hypothetical protein